MFSAQKLISTEDFLTWTDPARPPCCRWCTPPSPDRHSRRWKLHFNYFPQKLFYLISSSEMSLMSTSPKSSWSLFMKSCFRQHALISLKLVQIVQTLLTSSCSKNKYYLIKSPWRMIRPCLGLGHVHELLIVILGVHATSISFQPSFSVEVGYLLVQQCWNIKLDTWMLLSCSVNKW